MTPDCTTHWSVAANKREIEQRKGLPFNEAWMTALYNHLSVIRFACWRAISRRIRRRGRCRRCCSVRATWLAIQGHTTLNQQSLVSFEASKQLEVYLRSNAISRSRVLAVGRSARFDASSAWPFAVAFYLSLIADRAGMPSCDTRSGRTRHFGGSAELDESERFYCWLEQIIKRKCGMTEEG